MSDRETVQYTVTISPEGDVAIHNEDASQGYGWGRDTSVAQEIVEMLEDEGML